jgi:hypothetical protein
MTSLKSPVSTAGPGRDSVVSWMNRTSPARTASSTSAL